MPKYEHAPQKGNSFARSVTSSRNSFADFRPDGRKKIRGMSNLPRRLVRFTSRYVSRDIADRDTPLFGLKPTSTFWTNLPNCPSHFATESKLSIGGMTCGDGKKAMDAVAVVDPP